MISKRTIQGAKSEILALLIAYSEYISHARGATVVYVVSRCAHPNAAGLMMPNTTCNTGADNFNSTTGNFNSTDCGNATTTVAAFDNQCTFVAMSEEENITQLCKNFEYDTSLYPSSIVADVSLNCMTSCRSC